MTSAANPFELVTVAYEAEWRLLLLQARSLARYASRDDGLTTITVIDNSSRGMPIGVRTELMAMYGPLRDAVRVLRPSDLIRMPPATGWYGQQILKLVVARHVSAPEFVLLDAKNHLVDRLVPDHFRAPDGRLRTSLHDYRSHVLRRDLEGILRYFDLPVEEHVRSFVSTVTPFPMPTAVVKEMLDDVEHRSGRSFAAEFLRREALEFFFWGAWLTARRPPLDATYISDGSEAPIIWPKGADLARVRASIRQSREGDGPWFAVHRRALPALDSEARNELAAFWAERALFPSRASALEEIARLRAEVVLESRRQRRRDLGPRVLKAARVLPGRIARRAAASARRGRPPAI